MVHLQEETQPEQKRKHQEGLAEEDLLMRPIIHGIRYKRRVKIRVIIKTAVCMSQQNAQQRQGTYGIYAVYALCHLAENTEGTAAAQGALCRSNGYMFTW